MLPIAFAGTQNVGSISLSSSPINLDAGSSKDITCIATISDTDGWANITSVNATLWDTSASTENSEDDDDEHYTDASCILGENTSETERPITCEFSLHYHANPSTWTCKIRSYNSINDAASNEVIVDVNELAALDVTEASIDFGALDFNETSTDKTATVQNIGNVQIDVQLSGSAFTCTSGSLLRNSVHYNASSSIDYGLMAELTGTATTLDFDLAKSTGTSSTKLTYWKIKLPESGVGGTCSNLITFTAISG